VADVPEGVGPGSPVDEAARLLDDLPEVHAVLSHARGVRRLFQGERKRLLGDIRPLIAADPRLWPIALALSEQHSEPDAAVVALRTNLRSLLRQSSRTDLRSPHAVLRSREASEAEVQVTLAALLAALSMESGVATADGHPLAVVQVGERWALAGPLHAQPGRLEPLIPAVLPRQIETVAVPAAAVVTAAEPRCGWIAEFAP
jgi:hypothetical protein